MGETKISNTDLIKEKRLKELFEGKSVFEISTFYDCYEAAAILDKMLEEHKKMNEITSELQKISADAQEAFGKLLPAQINWRPAAAGWSVGQCFEHLIVTNDLYFPNIQKVIDGEHRNNFFSEIPFAPDLIAVLMKNSLNPEQKRKMKTFKIFEPAASDVSETIIDDFVENQQKLIAMVEAVKDFDVHKIKISEPVGAALNLRLDDAFEILVMHEKRHFKQAEKVTRERNFPK